MCLSTRAPSRLRTRVFGSVFTVAGLLLPTGAECLNPVLSVVDWFLPDRTVPLIEIPMPHEPGWWSVYYHFINPLPLWFAVTVLLFALLFAVLVGVCFLDKCADCFWATCCCLSAASQQREQERV